MIGDFCFWAKFFGLVCLVLDFRYIDFFFNFIKKREENARATNFYYKLLM